LIRILIDFLRLNASKVAGININQAVMLVVMAAAAVTIFLRHRSSRNKSSISIEGGN
jgi:hypothetical protein